MEIKSIVISKHAQDRLLQRMKLNPTKIQKIVIKALLSKDPLPKNHINKKEYNGHNGTYKFFLGYIFIFDKMRTDKNKLILVTVYKIRNKLI